MASNFPSTRWSLIARASSESDAGSREQMGELLTRYWRPMLVHLHYKGLGNEAAEDLVQDFVVELLDQNLLSIADPEKGKFRSLLLTALDHFLVSRLRHDHAAKRSPGHVASLNTPEFDQTQAADAGATLAFERAWALDVLAESLARLERECADSAETARWHVFHERIVLPLFTEVPETDYADLAARFGLGTEKAAMNVLVTAKRQFARLLREVIREYVTRTPGDKRSPKTGSRHSETAQPTSGESADLEEHQIRQAVEGEIAELQQVLTQSRPVADLVVNLCDEPETPDVAKTRFWRMLTEHDLESDSWSVLFAAGTEIDEQSLTAGCLEALQRPLSQVPGCASGRETTIGQVLRSAQPSLATLKALKNWFNLQRFSPARDVPAPLANGLYLTVLAVALGHCGERITGLADPQFRAGLEWLAAQPWLPEDLREVVISTHAALSE